MKRRDSSLCWLFAILFAVRRIGWLLRSPRRSTAFHGKRTERPTTPGTASASWILGAQHLQLAGAGHLVEDPGAADRPGEGGALAGRGRTDAFGGGTVAGRGRCQLGPGEGPDEAVATSVATRPRENRSGLDEGVGLREGDILLLLGSAREREFGGSTSRREHREVGGGAVCRVRGRTRHTPHLPSRFGRRTLRSRSRAGRSWRRCCGCTGPSDPGVCQKLGR